MASAAGGKTHTAHQNPADVELVDGLLSISRVLVAMAARTLAQVDVEVTLPQYRLLVVLATRGPQRTIDLAGELGVVPSTVTRTCDRLVRKGLARRYQKGADRRAVWVGLTASGRDLVGEVMRRRRESIAELVEHAAIRTLTGLASALRSLTVAAGEVPDPHWWQLWETSATADPSMWPLDAPAATGRPG